MKGRREIMLGFLLGQGPLDPSGIQRYKRAVRVSEAWGRPVRESGGEKKGLLGLERHTLSYYG